jgi:hypothetical protein
MYTQEEAKTKLCSVFSILKHARDIHCMGSDCAMWRFVPINLNERQYIYADCEEAQTEKEAGPIPSKVLKNHENWKFMPWRDSHKFDAEADGAGWLETEEAMKNRIGKGYCGLAGKP